MSHLRINVAGGWYHITARGNNRRSTRRCLTSHRACASQRQIPLQSIEMPTLKDGDVSMAILTIRRSSCG